MTTNITPGNTPKLKCEITLYEDGHYGIDTTRNGSWLPIKSARIDRDTTSFWRCERWDKGDHLPISLGRLDVHADDGEPDWRAIIHDMFVLSPEAEAMPAVIYPHVVPSGAGFDWQMEKDYRWVRQFKTHEEAEKRLKAYMSGLDEWVGLKGFDMDYWPLEPGFFGLGDLDQGRRRFRQTNYQIQPNTMMLGRFEIESLANLVGGPILIPARPEAYRFKPFELFGMTIYPVDEPTSFRVLG